MTTIRQTLKTELLSMQAGLAIISGRKPYMLKTYGWQHERVAMDQAAEYAQALQASTLLDALSRKNYGKKFIPNLQTALEDAKNNLGKFESQLATCTGTEADVLYLRTLILYYEKFSTLLSGLLA